ncbi:unnamed protein product [Durusdinium trenchii]
MLERPILERLAERKDKTKLCSVMFQKQYRMHDAICAFPSQHFYGNLLQNVQNLQHLPAPATVWPQPDQPVVWIDCDTPHQMGTVIQVGNARSLNSVPLENNTSLQNPGEADLIVEAYKRLMKDGTCQAGDVAIITPYKAQQQYIERKLKELPGGLGKRANETSVGTVFSMQGSERHFILLSFVRSIAEGWALKNLAMQGSDKEIRVAVTSHNPALRQTFESHIGIAAKANLLNVALTRAKSGLVIVGNRTVLSEGSEDFFQLASNLSERGSVVPAAQFRASSFRFAKAS